MTDFRAESKQMQTQLISWRRDFHRHPELAFEEQPHRRHTWPSIWKGLAIG